jgi:hypothetical protein
MENRVLARSSRVLGWNGSPAISKTTPNNERTVGTKGFDKFDFKASGKLIIDDRFTVKPGIQLKDGKSLGFSLYLEAK